MAATRFAHILFAVVSLLLVCVNSRTIVNPDKAARSGGPWYMGYGCYVKNTTFIKDQDKLDEFMAKYPSLTLPPTTVFYQSTIFRISGGMEAPFWNDKIGIEYVIYDPIGLLYYIHEFTHPRWRGAIISKSNGDYPNQALQMTGYTQGTGVVRTLEGIYGTTHFFAMAKVIERTGAFTRYSEGEIRIASSLDWSGLFPDQIESTGTRISSDCANIVRFNATGDPLYIQADWIW